MAIEFSMENQSYVDTNWAFSLSVDDPITITCWLKSYQDESYSTILGGQKKYEEVVSRILLCLRSRQLFLWWHDNSTGYLWKIFYGPDLALSQWYHVALVRDVNARTFTYYLDGAVYASPVADPSVSDTVVDGFCIAALWESTRVTYFHDCIIDDVAVWDVALTQNEINTLAKSKRRLALSVRGDHIVGYWRLDGPNGAVATGANSVLDLSGNGNHGTPYNDPVYRGSILTYPE